MRLACPSLALLVLLGCPAAENDPHPTGDGLFLGGCPVANESRARLLTRPSETPWGEEALAGPGDALLINEHAAFVIQGVGDPDTYYHYGGAPIDAVAVRGCEQAGPELLEEMGFIVGRLDLGDFNQSELHQIRGETIEVVHDGTDGKAAVVEVHAVDDRFWLVEMTLIRNVWGGGGRKELGALFGVDITLRYTLEPGASALQMEVLLDGEVAPEDDGFMVGAIVFPSDNTEVHAFADGGVEVGGFGLDTGVPWLAMGSAEGSLAVAMPEANMAYSSVAGVRALLDVNQALVPLLVNDVAEAMTPFVLAVGATDALSASASLEPYLPGEWEDVGGVVGDASGPVAGATVELRAENRRGDWEVIDLALTASDGSFSGRTLAAGGAWQAVASLEGRDDSAMLPVSPGVSAALTLGPPGELSFDVVDETGAAVPARVELERDDGAILVHYAMPGDTLPLAPGRWSAWVSRGYEYAIVETSVEVPESGRGTLSATLAHVVDTEGWASVDTHVHASASADSDTRNLDRFRTAAAAGLDMVVSTDHEAILDMGPALDESGLSDWVAYGLGSEVTATIPEHVNAWPFPASDDPRGDAVVWHQLGFPDLYAAIRARGARVVQLNHSRVNGECGILCLLDWDRVTDPPSTDDPEGLALPAGTELWSWDFDSFEVQNSLRSPLLDESDPQHTGALVDWLSFVNLGYPVTGVAVTDVHGLELPGAPRTYVRVPDDDPAVLTADDVADGELAGAAVMSSGAFAEVSISGAGPGELADGSAGSLLSLSVRGLAEIDVTRIFVLANCDSALALSTPDPGGLEKLNDQLALPLSEDSAIVVLGFGEASMPRGLEDYDALNVPRFITNPIFVDVDGDGTWTAPGPKSCDTGLPVLAEGRR